MLMKLNLQRFADSVKDKTSSGETWVLNQQISYASEPIASVINFTSNNNSYEIIHIDSIRSGSLRYYSDANTFDTAFSFLEDDWTNTAYRTITFNTPPTGELLTWLQANGTKQGGTDMPTDTKLSELVINYLTEEQLKTATINENELYLTDDDAVIPTKTSELENDSGYVTETQLNTKQDKLTATQLEATNSGANSTNIAQITTNKTNIEDINGKIPTSASSTNKLVDNTSMTNALANKQNALNSTQLNACNSGITSAKVTTYDGYGTKITTLETNVANKQDKLTAGYGIGITDDGTISVTIPDGTSKGY